MSRRRLLICITLGVASLAASIGVHFLSPIVRQLHLRRDMTWYDLGWHGLAPTRRYHSFDHPVAAVEFLKKDARCSQDHIFLSPRGPATVPGGVILDSNGEPVWRQLGIDGDVQDFKVQNYRGERFLTFWAGHEDNGRKEGVWYMLDETYTLRHQIIPGGSYDVGDMHEFHLTADGTALITVYEPIEADLSYLGGPSDGYLLDSIFQEVHVDTGEVIFEWSAYSHIPLNTTFSTRDRCSHNPRKTFGGCGNRPDAPFDFYHLNSVEKDAAGNFLVSGRSAFALSYIDGQNGNILWNLGGQLNEFEDLSDGQATGFSWQHHARLHEDGTTISLFDNAAHHPEDHAWESSAMIIEVDVANRTAKLRSRFHHPQHLLSFSQGNVQALKDSGNVFVGWGRSAAFTEFAASGEVLCDARFGAAAFFSFGPVTSYRIFRDDWIGKPSGNPDVASANGNIYVSWNGATEVKTWRVEGAHSKGDDKFAVLATFYKTGFETGFRLPVDGAHAFIRVAAVDANDAVLGVSAVIESPSQSAPSPLEVVILVMVMIGLGSVVSLCTCLVCYRRRAKRLVWGEHSYRPVDGESDSEPNNDGDEYRDDGVRLRDLEDTDQ